MYTITVTRARGGDGGMGVRASLDLLSEPEPYKPSVIERTFRSDVWNDEDLAIREVCTRYRAWRKTQRAQ